MYDLSHSIVELSFIRGRI